MNFIIVGAGIPGIYASLFLRRRYPLSTIHLIDSAKDIGGLYNSFEDSSAGVFDKGMHIIYETLETEIDSLIRSALPESEWNFLEGNRKDIAGFFFQGKLNTETPYINLDHLEGHSRSVCLGELIQSMENPLRSALEYDSSYEYFCARFGNSITDNVIEPIINKLWKTSSSMMHPASTRLVLMDRISIFSESTMIDLMKSKRIRDVIAYPNQLTLDLSNRSSQKGLYPKKFGLSTLVHALKSKLAQANIHIHLDSTIDSVQKSFGKINSVSFKSNKNSQYNIDDIKALVWCALVRFLSNKLEAECSLLEDYDPPLVQKYVYLLLASKPNMDCSYYYYSFESGTHTFRVTNYSSYCPNAVRNIDQYSSHPLYPVCVEMHFPNDYGDRYLDDNYVLQEAVDELILAQVISNHSAVKFSRVISIPSGFPLLTRKNVANLFADSTSIKNLDIQNLVLSGQSPEQGVFFLHEVLIALHESLKSI